MAVKSFCGGMWRCNIISGKHIENAVVNRFIDSSWLSKKLPDGIFAALPRVSGRVSPILEPPADA